MPLTRYVGFIVAYFFFKEPTLELILKTVGAKRTPVLKRLHVWLRHKEAQTGLARMSTLRLQGEVEADATGFRMYRDLKEQQNCHLALWALIARPPKSQSQSSNSTPHQPFQCLLYFLPVHKVDLNAVCPVECISDIEGTRAMQHVKSGSLLLSDGAKCYPTIAKRCGLLHASVAHSKGNGTSVNG